ncbi:hypothetical protein GCM10023205_01500 [Yinghuangia aomiensis]|uniref:N-6 DNA Methylase n=1 Tax=Yinghuangia aomiensis TaxID=676205 RepID=A0ABP9GLD3_9ACTN
MGPKVQTTGYAAYVRSLTQLVGDAAADRWSRIEGDIDHALNGEAAAAVRRLVDRPTRRAIGSFFTSGPVRAEFTDLLGQDLDNSGGPAGGYLDPACGAGDLLLSAAVRLPLAGSPPQTLRRWSTKLAGTDLQEPFVEAARLRLLLLVLRRHHDAGTPGRLTAAQTERAFPGLRQQDGLAALSELGQARQARRPLPHILLNPPFGPAPAPADCTWSTGKTSLAALFTAAAAEALPRGGRMTAILPDVLRSGSRYRAWRDRLAALMSVHEVRPHGQFDEHTDIDVFLLTGTRQAPARTAPPPPWTGPDNPVGHLTTIGDRFDVSVGPVVDFRDPHEGPRVPYLTARHIPAGDAMGLPANTRRYKGRLLTPPFVVMRRTSRPGQGVAGQPRSAGVLVLGDEPLAVDNHLITLAPKRRSGTGLRQSQRLLRVLGSPTTADWLDERIRCRHLTVTAVRGIPWLN